MFRSFINYTEYFKFRSIYDITVSYTHLDVYKRQVDSDESATMIIDVEGPATVTGADIQCPSEVTMISNDLVIAHVAQGAHLYLSLIHI